jgi:PAS domain-containing protein
MRTVCSQCRRLIGETATVERALAALDLCDECAAYALRLRVRIPGRERLESSLSPVLVTGADGRIVAANAAFAALTGRTPATLEGCLAGEAIGCERALLPDACGKSRHCRECTLRRMVAEVGRTRIARWRVPAYVITPHGRREICVTMRPDGEDLVVMVLEEIALRHEPGVERTTSAG